MALIDFGMKARRELAELRVERLRYVDAAFEDAVRICSYRDHLEEIANSTAKHASAVRLANIARKALGRPVGGGE